MASGLLPSQGQKWLLLLFWGVVAGFVVVVVVGWGGGGEGGVRIFEWRFFKRAHAIKRDGFWKGASFFTPCPDHYIRTVLRGQIQFL